MMLDGHLQIITIVHVSSASDQALNDQQALLFLRSADQAPNQLLLTSCNGHKGRSMDAIDALLAHKDTFASLKILNGETMLEEEEITFSIQKSS